MRDVWQTCAGGEGARQARLVHAISVHDERGETAALGQFVQACGGDEIATAQIELFDVSTIAEEFTNRRVGESATSGRVEHTQTLAALRHTCHVQIGHARQVANAQLGQLRAVGRDWRKRDIRAAAHRRVLGQVEARQHAKAQRLATQDLLQYAGLSQPFLK